MMTDTGLSWGAAGISGKIWNSNAIAIAGTSTGMARAICRSMPPVPEPDPVLVNCQTRHNHEVDRRWVNDVFVGGLRHTERRRPQVCQVVHDG